MSRSAASIEWAIKSLSRHGHTDLFAGPLSS
jgi:hypothetical protein